MENEKHGLLNKIESNYPKPEKKERKKKGAGPLLGQLPFLTGIRNYSPSLIVVSTRTSIGSSVVMIPQPYWTVTGTKRLNSLT